MPRAHLSARKDIERLILPLAALASLAADSLRGSGAAALLSTHSRPPQVTTAALPRVPGERHCHGRCRAADTSLKELRSVFWTGNRSWIS